jgi:hypothetical protein
MSRVEEVFIGRLRSYVEGLDKEEREELYREFEGYVRDFVINGPRVRDGLYMDSTVCIERLYGSSVVVSLEGGELGGDDEVTIDHSFPQFGLQPLGPFLRVGGDDMVSYRGAFEKYCVAGVGQDAGGGDAYLSLLVYDELFGMLGQSLSVVIGIVASEGNLRDYIDVLCEYIRKWGPLRMMYF